VTVDQEGRVYVYICQDDEVHWMHMLEVDSKFYFTFSFSDVHRRISMDPLSYRALQGHLMAYRSMNVKIVSIVSLRHNFAVDCA
jgi:hypothetical protein